MTITGDPTEGKDIYFDANSAEIIAEMVEQTTEQSKKITDAINNMLVKLGADRRFINGEADEDYRERAKIMRGLAPTREEEELKSEIVYLDTDYLGPSPLDQLLEYSEYTIDTACDEGFGSAIDGANFPQNTISGYSGEPNSVFYLTEEEAREMSAFDEIFQKAHAFDRDIIDESLNNLLPVHLSPEEIRRYPLIGMHVFAENAENTYPDMDDEAKSRLQHVLSEIQSILDQTTENRQILFLAHNRIEFFISCIGLARLKLIDDKITSDSNSFPQIDTDFSPPCKTAVIYDFKGYHISEDEAEAAKTKYLSWMDLEDKSEGEGNGEK